MINKHPNVNQYKSIYFADIKSQLQNMLLIFDVNKMQRKKSAQIQTHTKIVKDNSTIIESIKNNIQNDIKKHIKFNY
jgi:hypothetical protein